MHSMPSTIELPKGPPLARRADLPVSAGTRSGSLRRAFALGAALASASLGSSACSDEDDPYDDHYSYVDAGSSGAFGVSDAGTASPAPGLGTSSVDGAVGGASTGFVGSDSGAGIDAGSGLSGSANDGGSGATSDGGSTGDGGSGATSDGSSGSMSDAGGLPVSTGGSGDASGPPSRADLGEGDGSDVIMIGDSWMSLGDTTTGIQGGVLKASGKPYRPYAIGGTTLLGGGLLFFLSPIPTQYEEAVQADPDVKTVIMTAGGNDILQTGLQEDCQMQGDACGEQVKKVLDGLSKLWSEMAADRVQDVVYILYATPEGTSVDFALPDGDSARTRCAKVPAPLRCHIVETLDIVMGDIPDGIHPSQAASDRIGKAVVALMKERGLRR